MKKFGLTVFNVFLLVCACLFFSCTISLSDDDDDENEDSVGFISVTISSLVNQDSSASRAIVKADSVKLFLIKNDASEVELTDVTSSISRSSTKYTASVAVGTYSLRVEVYNVKNSATSPISSGTSTEFTVEAKKTPTKVMVSCIPNTEFVTSKSIGNNYSLVLKSEYENWYSFTATSSESDIVVERNDKSDDSKVTFAVFDSAGVLAKKNNTNKDSAKLDLGKTKSTLKVLTEANSLYYLVVYNATGGTEPTVNVSLSSNKVDDNTNSSNTDEINTDTMGSIEIVIS